MDWRALFDEGVLDEATLRRLMAADRHDLRREMSKWLGAGECDRLLARIDALADALRRADDARRG